VEVPLSWERLLWSQRNVLAPWERYALTDVRLVRLAGAGSDEIALLDVGDVEHHATWFDRVLGTATVVVHATRGRRQPLVLPCVRGGAQFAALLDLVSREPHSWDDTSVRAALAWTPNTPVMGYREAALSIGTLFTSIFLIAISLHGKSPSAVYAADDAIAPGGVKKDREAIVQFMEREVMPWARTALGPLKGGPDRIRCETCHGTSPAANDWRMPAVGRLPEPVVAERGWETYGGAMDAQMRNAIYGYIAESDNQARAAYMREVVMPGMARLLRRPPYDFTRSYEYNRTRVAFGCYHCHRVS
jgi:hypothetical protein